MVTVHKREPEDEIEQRLLDEGWKFAGISLFECPGVNGYFTKEQAMESGLGLYCPTCGACGESGCCSPSQCKCLYGEEYKREYREIESDWDKMYAFIHHLAQPLRYIDRYKLASQAQEVLDSLGEENDDTN